MYDIAVIGGGPAGVSAAVNAKLLNKNLIWIAGSETSKKVTAAPLIKNYIGLPDIAGEQLARTFKNHTDGMGIELKKETVTGVYQTGDYFTLLAGTNSYEAKSVILCLGVQTVKPVDGEEEFLGRGVSYCATCDGFLYKGKTIAVLCTDKSFEHEVNYLCGIAGKVYVIPLYRGYEITDENAEIIVDAPKKFTGGLKIERVEFKNRSVEVDGIFVLKSSISPATLVHGLKTENGHIVCDRAMRTNIDGIFCAGDCTGRPYQYIKAAGEGNVAAHSAAEYLSTLKVKEQ